MLKYYIISESLNANVLISGLDCQDALSYHLLPLVDYVRNYFLWKVSAINEDKIYIGINRNIPNGFIIPGNPQDLQISQ